MDKEIKHRQNKKRQFYIENNDKTLGFLDYTIEGNKMILTHTEVDEELKGTGSGKKLVDKAVEYANSKGYELEAECEYAAHVLRKKEAE